MLGGRFLQSSEFVCGFKCFFPTLKYPLLHLAYEVYGDQRRQLLPLMTGLGLHRKGQPVVSAEQGRMPLGTTVNPPSGSFVEPPKLKVTPDLKYKFPSKHSPRVLQQAAGLGEGIGKYNSMGRGDEKTGWGQGWLNHQW